MPDVFDRPARNPWHGQPGDSLAGDRHFTLYKRGTPGTVFTNRPGVAPYGFVAASKVSAYLAAFDYGAYPLGSVVPDRVFPATECEYFQIHEGMTLSYNHYARGPQTNPN